MDKNGFTVSKLASRAPLDIPVAIREDELQNVLSKGGKKMTVRCRFTSDKPLRFGVFYLEQFDPKFRAEDGAEIVPLQQWASDQKQVEEVLGITRSGLYVLRFLNSSDSAVTLRFLISE